MSSIAVAPSNPDSVSIGNYKGIMLCTRPCAGVLSSDPKKQKCGDAQDTSFICGTVEKPWGSNVVIQEKSRVLSRVSKKESALNKHKNWLKEMQEKRERIETERANEAHFKEEKKRVFMAKQAEKRAVVLGEGVDSREEEEVSLASSDALSAAADNDSICSKPAWALTEVAAKEVDDAAEAQEEEDLLSFANELDFEQYAYDMELKILMDQVKERIRALQKEKSIDESRLQAVMDSEIAAIRAEKLNSLSTDHMRIIGDDRNSRDAHGSDYDDDVSSIAESVRSERTIGSIHSQRSMEALVAKSRDKMDGSTNTLLEPITEQATESTMKPPVLITHTDDDGARLAETKSLNKLPFKNRNPAL